MTSTNYTNICAELREGEAQNAALTLIEHRHTHSNTINRIEMCVVLRERQEYAEH